MLHHILSLVQLFHLKLFYFGLCLFFLKIYLSNRLCRLNLISNPLVSSLAVVSIWVCVCSLIDEAPLAHGCLVNNINLG